MKPNLGSQPLRLERYLLPFIVKEHADDRIIIHHFINHPDKIQLEIERRWKENNVTKLSFERIFL